MRHLLHAAWILPLMLLPMGSAHAEPPAAEQGATEQGATEQGATEQGATEGIRDLRTGPTEWINLETGQSLVWRGEKQISRVLVSNPEVAEVKLLEEEQFQLRGVREGNTDLWVWYRREASNPVKYDVNVHRDLSELIRRVEGAVEGEPPSVYPLQGRLVLEGVVDDIQVLEHLASLARIYDPEFVNLLSVRGDHQVQLQVVFAEVSRTGLREMGVNAIFSIAGIGGQWYGPNYGDVDTLNEMGRFPTTGAFQVMGAMSLDGNALALLLGALEQKHLSKTLAEPTLVALSGQKAEFLAGGEVPFAISTFEQVRVQFKEYGIKLVFVPTVMAGGLIDLRVHTEVSELDPSVAISVGGMAIPGFSSRKGESHLRLQEGKTFAMAGLLSENVQATRSEIPLLGRLPLVGALFRYIKHEREETELMIFVTPRLVRPLAPDEVPPPPTASENNNPNDFELFMLGMIHRSGSREFDGAGPVGMER